MVEGRTPASGLLLSGWNAWKFMRSCGHEVATSRRSSRMFHSPSTLSASWGNLNEKPTTASGSSSSLSASCISIQGGLIRATPRRSNVCDIFAGSGRRMFTAWRSNQHKSLKCCLGLPPAECICSNLSVLWLRAPSISDPESARVGTRAVLLRYYTVWQFRPLESFQDSQADNKRTEPIVICPGVTVSRHARCLLP